MEGRVSPLARGEGIQIGAFAKTPPKSEMRTEQPISFILCWTNLETGPLITEIIYTLQQIVCPRLSLIILLAGLFCQTAQAVLLHESGTAVLADNLGATTGPDALIVDWSVDENAALVYTYTYTVDNPVGDSTAFSSFSVGFDTTQPGAFVAGSQTGGALDLNNGALGLDWDFAAVQPGANSGPLSFESTLLPMMGDANASGGITPPSPWSSNPDGQEVPVPETSVPDSMNTLAALAGVLLLLPLRAAWNVRHGQAALH